MKLPNNHILPALALWASSCHPNAWGQIPTVSVLEIEVDRAVLYVDDITDYAKLASDPNMTIRLVSRNFNTLRFLGDIISVNGKPAKGTFTTRGHSLSTSPNPTGGVAIADTTRGWMEDVYWEIQQADGTPIGTVMATGFRQGPAPPGSPSSHSSNFAITGGTGAFMGARGQASFVAAAVAARAASVSEDPGNRRTYPGGRIKFLLYLVPLTQPEIQTAGVGPALFHSDFSAVTEANPARGGETLMMTVTGLGPTRPGIEPGKPFPAAPLETVNSPVEVTVNGESASVVNSIGYPGTQTMYRVDFRLPEGTVPGNASVRVSAAWVASPSVSVPVR